MDKDQVLEIVDSCFKKFASTHRAEAKEYAKELIKYYTQEQPESKDSDKCRCPMESTDVYNEHGKYLGYVCQGCGYFSNDI